MLKKMLYSPPSYRQKGDRKVKRIKIIVLAVASAAVVSVVTTASAAVPIPFGWYVEGNVGVTQLSHTSYGSGSSVTSKGAGYNINGGYKFSPFFAGEVGVTRYANGTIKNAGTTAATTKQNSADLAGKGILPITDTGFELFAKVGIAWVRTKMKISNAGAANGLTLPSGTTSTSNLFIGLGGDYSITPNLPVNIQWQRARGNNKTGTLDLYSIGLSYTFG